MYSLNFVSKDCDEYYFVNYLALLQELPPMIGKMVKISEDKINEMAIQKKLDVIKSYQAIVKNGLQIENESVKIKYISTNLSLNGSFVSFKSKSIFSISFLCLLSMTFSFLIKT